MRSARRAGIIVAVAALCGTVAIAQRQTRTPDVIFVPSSDHVIDAMLKMAKVTSADVVYDLGCGDGRIVIRAAKQYGAKAVGIDIDPARIKEANARAKTEGVESKVTFIQGDIFDPAIKIDSATVVTLFLLDSLNERLKPRLLKELKPGTRVVSNSFTMGKDWPPAFTQPVDAFVIYGWTIPKR